MIFWTGTVKILANKSLNDRAPALPCPRGAALAAALPCPALGGAALAAALPCPDLRAAEEKEQGAALPCPVAPPVCKGH